MSHHCDAPGCGSHLVFDAGMTPHRPVCGAKLSGVRVFRTAGVTTLIGCPKMPLPNSKYCAEHKVCDMPVIGSDKVAKETREKLYRKRKETATAEEAGGDDFYVIESVVEKKEENHKKLFKIKWAGFSSDENTWEGEGSVPGFIQKFYEDDNNLGKPLPKPMIKHTKRIGNTEYHYLKWGTQKGGQWLNEDYFKVVTEDGEVSTMAATPEVSCGTRKSRDKRVKRHTVGLFVVAYPCGVVVVCDELFGSESISQVSIFMFFGGGKTIF